MCSCRNSLGVYVDSYGDSLLHIDTQEFCPAAAAASTAESCPTERNMEQSIVEETSGI